MERIDAHCHVWIPENKAYPYREKGMKVNLHPGSVELLLDVMNKNGISRTVLIQPGHYGPDNSYMMDCCDRYPGKFAAVIRVDAASPQAAEDLEFWVRQRGAQGLRLTIGGYTDQTWRKGQREYGLWEKIEELGIAVGYIIQPHQAKMVEDMLRKFPQVPVIIDHLGLPKYDNALDAGSFETILKLAEYPQVFLKMSAMKYLSDTPFPHEDILPVIRKAVDAFGSGRIMWATDFCFTHSAFDYYEAIDIVERHMPFLSDRDRSLIFAGTAEKIFKFDRKQP